MGADHFNSVGCQNAISAKQELKRPDEFNDGLGGEGREERGASKANESHNSFHGNTDSKSCPPGARAASHRPFVPNEANKPQFALHWIV